MSQYLHFRGASFCALLAFTFALTHAANAAELRLALEDDAVAVYVDEELFTTYKYSDDQKYPYFFPVNGPQSGASVTTESSEPYPHHHSLFFGCDKVNGANYWQGPLEAGQILSEGAIPVKEKGSEVSFKDSCLWQVPGEDAVLRDERTITITAPEDGLRVIDFEIMMEALEDVRIEQSNHSLFAARVVPELSVEEGGVLINADGERGEEATYGKKAPWCAYYGERDGVTEGIAILQSPQNRWYPAPWFTRDYGFFSPTPMQWLEEGHVDLAKGEALVLHYRVLVFTGTAEEADIAAEFEKYKEAQLP